MNIRKKTALIAIAVTAFVAVGCTANAKQWQENVKPFKTVLSSLILLKCRRVKKPKLWLLGKKRVIF